MHRCNQQTLNCIWQVNDLVHGPNIHKMPPYTKAPVGGRMLIFFYRIWHSGRKSALSTFALFEIQGKAHLPKLGEFLVASGQHPGQDLSDYTCSVVRKYYLFKYEAIKGLAEANGLSCIMTCPVPMRCWVGLFLLFCCSLFL